MSIRHTVLASSLVLLIKTVDEKVPIFSGEKANLGEEKA
ncbi:hypothetical protein D024_3338 [Vibrio parahaemolyticus 3259]|nr:hypothetical protein D024_3338 [Vibrio parahaemolyticus 3259]ETJ93110.1 hypothetical protein D041_1255 [Vibrio parahaemolyticus EKP-008]